MEGSENVNRPNGVKGAKVIQVIETKAMRGLGTEKDPVILSILVDTFISKISFPMQPGPEIGSISDA